MGQVKIYGLRDHLLPIRDRLSDILHSCIVDAFSYPVNKKIQRFFYLNEEDFFFPEDRSRKYTIIELTLFEGRSNAAKKALYSLLFERFEQQLGITSVDLEITLYETPRENWGLRGKAGDDLDLTYEITV